MRIRTITSILLVLVGLVVLAYTGTAEPQDKKRIVVGKWGAAEWRGNELVGEIIEFFPDGTGVTDNERDGVRQLGFTWTILEDGRLKMDSTYMGTHRTLLWTVTRGKTSGGNEYLWLGKDKPFGVALYFKFTAQGFPYKNQADMEKEKKSSAASPSPSAPSRRQQPAVFRGAEQEQRRKARVP